MIPRILTVGHTCLDVVHITPKIPKPNTKVTSTSVEIRIGGNAANAAAALADLGAKADLCTVFGTPHHPFTRILLTLLTGKGVGILSCTYDESQPCPSSTILVLPDGERAIVNWQGETIRNATPPIPDLDGYDMILADAYRLPMVRKVFAMAKERGIPTMLDVDGCIDDIGSIPSADHIWFSHEAWWKHRIPITDLQARFGGVVGITDGYRPIRYTTGDGKVHLYQPPQCDATNTLGAGDVFRARLGMGLCIGEDFDVAVANASATACEHIVGKELRRVIP